MNTTSATKNETAALDFLTGSGEMEQRIRQFNWLQTPLGSPAAWPASLRVVLGTVLSSPFPMMLYWGEDLICFYNDAFRPSLGGEGRHPSMLGSRARDAWPEIWESVAPLIQEGFSGGTSLFQDRLLPIYRNGNFEDVYWTFSHSPVKDENGTVQGVLVVCKETTGRVAKFHTVVEQSSTAIVLLRGEDLVIEEANQAALDLWQKGPEVIGRPYTDALPEVQDQQVLTCLKEVYQSGMARQGFEQPVYHFNKNGDKQDHYLNFEFKPFREADGTISGVMVMSTNVTQQVRTRQQLSATENDIREAVEAANLGYWNLDPQTQTVKCNREIRELFGLPADETVDLSLALASIHPADRERAIQTIEAAMAGENGGYCDMEYRVVNPFTRQVRYIRSVGQVYFNEQRKPFRFSGTVQDISKIKASEQALFESEERLRIATVSANVGTWSYDLKENKVYASDQYKKLFGVSPEREMTYELFVSAVLEEDRTLTDQLNRDVIAMKNGLSDYEWEYRIRGIEDGELRWLKARGKVYTDAEGNPARFAGAVIDVTKEKITEENIRRSEQRFRTIFETVPVSVWEEDFSALIPVLDRLQQTHDNQLEAYLVAHPEVINQLKPLIKIKNTNQASLHMFEAATKDELLRRLDLVFEDAQPFFLKLLLAFSRKERYFRGESVLKTLKGRRIFASVSMFLADKDDYSSVLVTRHDSTDHKRAEEELEALVQQRTRELQSSNQDLQQFAHVASHDLKEPVRKIRTFAGRLQSDKSSSLSENGQLFLSKIEKSAQRMYDMIDGVLTFSTLSATQEEPKPVDLNEILAQIESDLEIVIQKTGARLQYHNLPVVIGAPVLMHQLFYNLLNNSLKFARTGVPPHISIIADNLELEGQRFAEIIVRDNGIGFEQQQAQRIFDTFTRLHSKDRFEGTGLGLSLCKRIAERHGGRIHARGVVNQGAEIILQLPAGT